MTDFLPLFPLKMVVFPGEKLNLHIFEPRYRQLIRECEQNGVTFGIPCYLDDQLSDFGTEIRLVKIEKRFENGEMDIRTEGVGIFKIHEFYRVAPQKLYSGADIRRVVDPTRGDFQMNAQILQMLAELFQLLNIKKEIPENSSSFQTYEIAHHVGFSLEQEYEFLCIPTEVDRQEYLQSHLERLIPTVMEMERLRKKAQMNGHFKNVIPPEV